MNGVDGSSIMSRVDDSRGGGCGGRMALLAEGVEACLADGGRGSWGFVSILKGTFARSELERHT